MNISPKTRPNTYLTTLGAVLFLLLFSLFVVVGVLLARTESERYLQQEIDSVQDKLENIRLALQTRIYSNIYQVSAITALAAIHPELTQDEFAKAMRVQFRGEHDLINVGLARDMVIQFMYPVEGNEAAIGLDYTTLPDQFAAVDLALRLNEIILAGPVALVQGGEGIIARIPIHITDTTFQENDSWGVASVVMNSESIFAGVGIKKDHDLLRIAIRGRDASGPDGEIFWGDPLVFETRPMTQLVELPYGSWQIAAIPATGWRPYSWTSTPVMPIYLATVLIILGLTALIILLLDKMEKSAHERSVLGRSLEIFLKQTSDFVYYKDINSRFIFCSQTLADITGHQHWQAMIGKHDFEVFPYEMAKIYHQEEEPILNDGQPLINKVNPYFRTNGEIGYVQTNKWPVFDSNNNISGIFGISRDITEQKKAFDLIEKERDIFSEGPVFSIEWNPEHQGHWPIKHASSNVESILGYSQAEMQHPEFSYPALIHPDDLESVVSRLKHNIAEHVDRFEESYRLRTRAGQYLWVYDFTVLIRDEAGQLTGIRSYLYDQSAQKQAEEALRIAEKRLEQTAYELTENIPVGTYTMVQPAEGGMANFAFMSSRFLELLGLTREEVKANPQSPFSRVHPDDIDAFMALNARVFKDKSTFFAETRILAANDEVRWITAESKPRTLPNHTTVWEGVVTDVTDRKRAEEALSESLRRFNDLVDRVSVGVYVFWHRANGTMEFEYVSDSWCEMNQIQREELLKNPFLAWDVIHPDEFEDFKKLNQQVARERRNFVWEGRIIVGGHIRFVLIESTPVFFDNGDSRWFGFEQDISERRQAEAMLQKTNFALEQEITERKLVEQELKNKTELLEKLSMLDGLTEIPNRRNFDERAELEWKRALRTGFPISLVMIDIDHFKQYNDHYGHGAGDDCLKQVAQALEKSCVRPLDLVARYGGEEFVALLPETAMDGALHLAEQMRFVVEQLAIAHDFSSVAKVVTLSVGVAMHGKESIKTDLQHLQTCADQALYQAKHQGRNRVYSQ